MLLAQVAGERLAVLENSRRLALFRDRLATVRTFEAVGFGHVLVRAQVALQHVSPRELEVAPRMCALELGDRCRGPSVGLWTLVLGVLVLDVSCKTRSGYTHMAHRALGTRTHCLTRLPEWASDGRHTADFSLAST